MPVKSMTLFVLGPIENREYFYHWVRGQRIRNWEPVTHMRSTHLPPALSTSCAYQPCDEYMIWDSSMVPFVQEQVCRFGCVSLFFEG